MTGTSPSSPAMMVRERRTPFFQIGNEIPDVFQPLMGPQCFTIYSHFVRRAFKNPELKHSIRDLAEVTGMGLTTISRSLEILECLGLMKLIRRGGSQESSCKLLDSVEAAMRLGATYQKSTLSWLLPKEVKQRRQEEIKAIRHRQLGKHVPKATPICGNPSHADSQKNASVAPLIRQRVRTETQTDAHLLQEEKRIEKTPTPTPTPNERGEAWRKNFPNEDERERVLKMATVVFTGVVNDFRNLLLDARRPPLPHLANGAEEWRKFGFGTLAVEAAAQCGNGLMLTLSALDPEAARRGLQKYRKTWDAILRKWYECAVQWEILEG